MLGAMYALVGIVFAWPAGHPQAWRIAAWLVSGLAYTAHVTYECFRLRNPPFSAALHVALAAALGAFGLALAALLHALRTSTTPQHQLLLCIALLAWPAITGVAAFFVGLVLSFLCRILRRNNVA